MIMIVIYSAMTGSINARQENFLICRDHSVLTSVWTVTSSCEFILNGILTKSFQHSPNRGSGVLKFTWRTMARSVPMVSPKGIIVWVQREQQCEREKPVPSSVSDFSVR